VPILSEDEEYKQLTQEAEALLGINLEELIKIIKDSKADGWYMSFEKEDFQVALKSKFLHKDVLVVTFESADRSRTFTAQLVKSNIKPTT